MDAAMKMKRGHGQGYMMRSQRRRGYGGTPPQRPKKSVWYQVLTILMLIVFCPVGLIMLWRKRLKWKGGIKFLATLLSLAMLFLELGAALWYPFEDERIRAVQNNVSAVLEQAMEAGGELIEKTTGEAAENWNAFWNNGREIGAAAGNHALGLLLDAIASPSPVPTNVPPMTLTAGQSSEDIPSLLHEPTATPTTEPTATPTTEPTATPTTEPTATPTAEPTTEPTATPTAEPTATPTTEPTAAPEASANVLERPTPSASMLPTFDPSASATPVPPVTPTPTPTATPVPTPTAEPTIDPASIPRLQAPGEMTVWHTSDGKYYHKESVCGSMSNAREHTLSSAIAAGKKACPYCHPVETKWAKEKEPTVFVGSDNYWHVRTGCESCTDTYTPMLLAEVRTSYQYAPCDACGSRYYVDGVPSYEEATPAPDSDATSAPTAQAMKGGDVMVWHTSNGKWYHKASKCGSMSNASEHTLESAVSKGKTACPYCHPINEEWAKTEDEVAFVSEKNVWHIDGNCSANAGDYIVMTVTAARADGALTACGSCGADRYAGAASAQTAPDTSATESSQTQDTPVEDGLNLSSVVNGDVLVYYSANTSHYHRRDRCASSTTTVFQPHTLMEALLEEKITCPVCNPPEPETN